MILQSSSLATFQDTGVECKRGNANGFFLPGSTTFVYTMNIIMYYFRRFGGTQHSTWDLQSNLINRIPMAGVSATEFLAGTISQKRLSNFELDKTPPNPSSTIWTETTPQASPIFTKDTKIDNVYIAHSKLFGLIACNNVVYMITRESEQDTWEMTQESIANMSSIIGCTENGGYIIVVSKDRKKLHVYLRTNNNSVTKSSVLVEYDDRQILNSYISYSETSTIYLTIITTNGFIITYKFLTGR